MYKIFFKEGTLILTGKVEQELGRDFNAIHKFSNEGELKKFVQHIESQGTGQKAFVYYHDEEELFERFKACFKNLTAAGGLVWNHNRTHFLTITRLGQPDLPKGKLESGETPEQAATREVTEECGIAPLTITAPLTSTFHIYYLNHVPILKKTHWFEMIYAGKAAPTPQREENISNVFWTPREEREKFLTQTYPSMREVLNASSMT